MVMADRSCGLLRKVNCGSGTPYANGNGRQLMRPPPQSELRKRNALYVLITEVQAQTGHAASSAKSVAEAERLMCVNNGITSGKWQTGHAASSAKSVAEAECLMCVNN